MLTSYTMRKSLLPLSLLLGGLMLVGRVGANPTPAQIQAAQLRAFQAAQRFARTQAAHALKAEHAAQMAAQAQAKAQATQAQKVVNAEANQVKKVQHNLHKLEKKELVAALGQIVNELHATKILLESADHDYKGHRRRQ